MTDQIAHDEAVAAMQGGYATDEQLADALGITPDVMNKLAAQWRGPEETRREFLDWYGAVLKPLNIPADPAFEMFSGDLSIDDFVAGLTEKQVERFTNEFPGLQEKYQATLDAKEDRRNG